MLHLMFQASDHTDNVILDQEKLIGILRVLCLCTAYHREKVCLRFVDVTNDFLI